MVKDFLRAPGSHTGETVGNNLHIEIPLTNCKVLYQGKKKQNIKCAVCSQSFCGCGWETSSQEEGTVLTPVLPQCPSDAHNRHLIAAAGGRYGSRVHCMLAAQLYHVTSLGLGFLIYNTRDFTEMKSPLFSP